MWDRNLEMQLNLNYGYVVQHETWHNLAEYILSPFHRLGRELWR